MASWSWLEIIGEVVDVLPAGKYKVKLVGMDFVVTWYKAGNMKRNNIAIMLWDYVKLEVNEYDNTQWRITYRYKYPPLDEIEQMSWASVEANIESTDQTTTEPVTQPIPPKPSQK